MSIATTAGLRRTALYFCLSGMDLAWVTPLLLIIWQWIGPQPPMVLFGGLWGLLLAWMALLALLGRTRIRFPWYHLGVAFLVGLSTVGLVYTILYRGMPLADRHWATQALTGLLLFELWPTPELLLVLLSFFLWQRASWTTRRAVDFSDVRTSFWIGLVLLTLGAALFHALMHRPAPPFLAWAYFGLGLLALIFARTDERPFGARSVGGPLAPGKLALFALLAALTLALGLGFWRVAPEPVRAVLVWLWPIWTILLVVVQLLALLLAFAGVELFQIIDRLLHGQPLIQPGQLEALLRSLQETAQRLAEELGLVITLPPWFWLAARITVLLIVVVPLLLLVLVVLGVIAWRREQADSELSSAERPLVGSGLRQGLEQLRDLARLVRRHGLHRGLLAALSVQALYANLCRLAHRRGYPRRPSQPPDSYLPTLVRAFHGADESLARLTAAYMRVHYGDQEVTPAELMQLRADYAVARRAGKVVIENSE